MFRWASTQRSSAPPSPIPGASSTCCRKRCRRMRCSGMNDAARGRQALSTSLGKSR
jgi:hypothetical protein